VAEFSVRELGSTAKATTAAPIVVRISGEDARVLQQLGEEVRERLERVPNLVEPRRAWKLDEEQHRLEMDRLRAGTLGLGIEPAAGQLAAAVGGLNVGEFFSDAKTPDPIRLEFESSRSPTELDYLDAWRDRAVGFPGRLPENPCAQGGENSIVRAMSEPSTSALPRHVAIIMDGNGRWAKQRALPRLAGHEAGARAVKRITTHARRIGVPALTLYAFSQQNWGRPATEVEGLMKLLGHYITVERAEILDNDIRFSTIGDLSKLPRNLQDAIADLKQASAGNRGMDFCIALSYGGREELLRAARATAAACVAGELTPETLDESEFEKHLYTSHLPPLDLLIRTSGELRISNFLLWQCAYAELVFTPVCWPDFSERDLDDAIARFCGRQRRFGLTPDQISR
jgi:undecaprenyl diphosphate synthase